MLNEYEIKKLEDRPQLLAEAEKETVEYWKASYESLIVQHDYVTKKMQQYWGHTLMLLHDLREANKATEHFKRETMLAKEDLRKCNKQEKES